MRYLIHCIILALAIPCYGTAQIPDVLIVHGEKLPLFANPLENYFNRFNRPAVLSEGLISSGNWRGYKATWEIDDGRLYLVKVEKQYRKESSESNEREWRELPISLIFEDAGQRVFATWFSGTLIVPKGERLAYVHMGYGSKYERELRFIVDSGEVVSIDEVRNDLESMPNECDTVAEQLRTMTPGGGNSPELATLDPGKLFEIEKLRVECQQAKQPVPAN